MYDEPYGLDEETRAHYQSCGECQGRFSSVADDARYALSLMAVPGATVDPVQALVRTRSRSRPTRSVLAVLSGRWKRPLLGGLAFAVVAAGLAATMAFTPLAANLVQIFQPSQVTPVVINQGDLNGLDVFSTWGDVKGGQTPSLKETETAQEASQVSGLPAIKVDAGKLPSGLARAPVSYAAVGQSSGTVTFNGNAPAKLRGSTLTVVVGPAETAVYGDLGKLAQSARASAGGTDGAKQQGAGSDGARQPESGQRAANAAQQAISSAGPLLAIAEMKAPQISSTGASVSDIKSALLAQPGLSPAVRQAISSIDSPTGNLPIPIPAGQVNAHSVKVQGVSGTAVGDSTGLGSAVIWIKSGRVYAVAGTVTEDQVLAVANSVT
jgi:hypothetical protein